MQEAPIPENEAKRLAALWALEILDTAPEERFDRITKLAAKTLFMPIVTITLVDSSREWFKSAYGLKEQESPRAFSFCGHAIVQEEPLIVHNALQDGRFYDNPFVIPEKGIRFYAGQSLIGPGGQRIGVFSIRDFQPRKLDDEEKAIFKAFANWAEFELNFGNERSALLHIGLDEKLTNLAQRIEAWSSAAPEHHKIIKRESRFHHRSTV
jgi:GAF domain-containing protein